MRQLLARVQARSFTAAARGAPLPATGWVARDVDEEIAEEALNKRQGLALVGEYGVGKSISLCKLVDRARESDWLVLHLPRMSEMTFGDGTYVRRLRQPGQQWPLYERPEHAVRILADLAKVHSAQLATLSCPDLDDTFLHILETGELPTPSNLLELVGCGLTAMEKVDHNPDNNMFAVADVYDVVVNELKQQSQIPVLFALDEYNTILGLTDFKDETLKTIHSNAIRMTRPLRDLTALNDSITNGVAVAAMTETCSMRAFGNERASRVAVYGGEDPESAMQSLTAVKRKLIPSFTLQESIAMIEQSGSNLDKYTKTRWHTLVGGRARLLQDLLRFSRAPNAPRTSPGA